MKYFVLLAAALVIASAELVFDEDMVSGSNAGSPPPVRDFTSDYVTGMASQGDFEVVSHKVLAEPLIGQTITGHALVIQGGGECYHTYTHNDKCPGTGYTSKTAEAHGCTIATNAGFFGMSDNSCIGPIISDGQVIHTGSSLGALFGVTEDGKLVAGYINQEDIQNMNLKQLVQGRGWLIRDGQSYLDTAAQQEGISKSFIQLLAPRLAIGWTNEGHIILVVVDGVESKKKGIDLKTFTQLLLDLGAVNAINLDGGGSVTFVWDGHVCESSGVAREACDGNPTQSDPNPYLSAYERAVTSITCFK